MLAQLKYSIMYSSATQHHLQRRSPQSLDMHAAHHPFLYFISGEPGSATAGFYGSVDPDLTIYFVKGKLLSLILKVESKLGVSIEEGPES